MTEQLLPTGSPIALPTFRPATEHTPLVSIRAAALERAKALRTTYHTVARENADVPPGHVLAIAVRCSQDLRRAGCTDDRYPEAIERLLRAILMAQVS